MQPPWSWASTEFDDGTEINNVDFATRENSNTSQLLLREIRERGEVEKSGACFLLTPWLLWMVNSFWDRIDA